MASLQMKAIFDCKADRHGEISFKEGDIFVDIVESTENGWYEGRLENGSERGLIPINYVETLKLPYKPNTQLPGSATRNQGTEKPINFGNISDQFIGNLQKRNFSSPRPTFSEDKGLNNLVPAVSSLKSVSKRAEEPPKSGMKVKTSNVMGILQQKSVEIRQEGDTVTQNHSTPFLSSTKSVKIDRGGVSVPILQVGEHSITHKFSFQQLAGMYNLKSAPSNNNQFVKPSQLKNIVGQGAISEMKQALLPQSPPALSPRPTTTARSQVSTLSNMDKTPSHTSAPYYSSGDTLTISSPKNPVPPLPSRPRSAASRKPHINRIDSSSNSKSAPVLPPKINIISSTHKSKEKEKEKEEEEEHEKSENENKGRINPAINRLTAPAIKPKSTNLPPVIPPRPKSSQLPSTTKLDHRPSLHLVKSDDALATKRTYRSPPIIPPKPSMLVKTPLTKSPILPPKPAKTSRTKMNNCQSPTNNEKDQLPNPAPVDNDLSTNKETNITEKIISLNELEGKAPPPMPPSRMQKPQRVVTTARYEILFETIQVNGYVDEEMTQAIWRKHRLSKEDMDCIWKKCDTGNKKVLNKDSFINSMRMIDTLFSRQEHAI